MIESETENQVRSLDANLVEIKSIRSVVPDHAKYSSLMGQVMDVRSAVTDLNPGDVVIAIAPPATSVVIPAESCRKLANITPHKETTGSYWPLALILATVLHRVPIELGERVLVLSSGLMGQMLGDIACLAGAISCVVFDPKHTNANGYEQSTGYSRGVEWAGDMSGLDIRTPAKSIDLLIDISNDPELLQMNLGRIRDTGRVLVVGECNPMKFDVNLYPDFHRRSLNFINYRLPTSLRSIEHNCGQGQVESNPMYEVIEYLFENGLLNYARWPITRLIKPNFETLDQMVTLSKNQALSIEW